MVQACIILAFILVILATVSYCIYRFIIIRRNPTPLPCPEDAPANRRWAVTHYAAQVQWLEDWGYEIVSIQNEGLRLQGYFFRAKSPTDKTVLAIHGYRCDGGFREYAYIAEMYLQHFGYNLLLVDDRAHHASEGKRIGFSVKDKLDCLAWADWLLHTQGPSTQIILQGVSMGAATVLLAAGSPSLPDNITHVVADCGYANLKEQIQHVMKRNFHMPAFPLYHLASLWCRLLAGYWFGQGNVEEATRHIKVPVQFIHGSADNFVPTSNVYRLHAACTAAKQLLIVDGAAHAESFLVDKQAYQDALDTLFSL